MFRFRPQLNPLEDRSVPAAIAAGVFPETPPGPITAAVGGPGGLPPIGEEIPTALGAGGVELMLSRGGGEEIPQIV